jgi:hypothetical protein
MKKNRNSGAQGGSEGFADDNDYQNNDQIQDQEVTDRPEMDEDRIHSDREPKGNSQDDRTQSFDANNRNQGQKDQYDESDDSQDSTDEYGDDDQYDEQGVEQQQDQDSDEGKFDIKKIAQRVMDYIKDENGSLDREAILKYVSVAIVAIYGVRKGGIIGGLLVSAAAGLVAKYVTEYQQSKQGQGEGESEQGQENEQEYDKTPAMA